MLKQLVAMVAMILILLLWIDINLKAPDPYRNCDAETSTVERDQCRNFVHFALSAGW